MANQRAVIILGSTGSIGTQALEVIAQYRDFFRVYGCACSSNANLLSSQVRKFAVPACALVNAPEGYEEFFDARTLQFVGENSPVELLNWAVHAARSDGFALEDIVVLNGITGAAGLPATLASLQSGATLALANKESLVIGGALVREKLTRIGQIVPVDSEHSAIFQSLMAGVHRASLTLTRTHARMEGSHFSLGQASEVSRIILTASGGPFRGKKREELAHVSAEMALHHPTWKMGPVVTINSSTLMNKALELIEAAYLFDVPPSCIEPVVHPQSIVHSMVEFCDGVVIAQASPPNMKVPIALGLSWPFRLADIGAPMQFTQPSSWDFEPIDHQTFPALGIARSCLEASAYHPAVMNAANEECVDAFLRGQLPYLGIVDSVERVLNDFSVPKDSLSYESLLAVDAWARIHAREIISRFS